MKKLLTLLCLAVIPAAFFSSCKKHDVTVTQPTPYVKFKINGQEQKLIAAGVANSDAFPSTSAFSKTYILTAVSTSPNAFEVVMFNNGPLKTNDTFTSGTDNNNPHGLAMAYVYNGDGLDASSDTVYMTLKITDVAAGKVKGIFSGILTGTSGTLYTITDGEFYAPYIE
jgi:hypothetical protein